LINLIWASLSVPLLWTISMITCLHKKGSQSDPKNYRGISIAATFSRLVPFIIMRRLQAAYDKLLDPSQCGFRSNSGCDDAIYILRNVMDRSGDQLFLAFIDLTAAYDRIPRDLLFRALSVRLGCSNLVSLLKSIYTNTTAKIRGLESSFHVSTGCRQGGIESPVLFNIYFDTVCRVLDNKLSNTLQMNTVINLNMKFRANALIAPRKLTRRPMVMRV